MREEPTPVPDGVKPAPDPIVNHSFTVKPHDLVLRARVTVEGPDGQALVDIDTVQRLANTRGPHLSPELMRRIENAFASGVVTPLQIELSDFVTNELRQMRAPAPVNSSFAAIRPWSDRETPISRRTPCPAVGDPSAEGAGSDALEQTSPGHPPKRGFF